MHNITYSLADFTSNKSCTVNVAFGMNDEAVRRRTMYCRRRECHVMCVCVCVRQLSECPGEVMLQGMDGQSCVISYVISVQAAAALEALSKKD